MNCGFRSERVDSAEGVPYGGALTVSSKMSARRQESPYVEGGLLGQELPDQGCDVLHHPDARYFAVREEPVTVGSETGP